MQISLAPFLFCLLLSHRLYRFTIINNRQQWKKMLYYARALTIFLGAAEIILHDTQTTKWVWQLFLGSLLVFAYMQKEMRPLRMYLLAFVPYFAVTLTGDLAEVLAVDIHNRWEGYFGTAEKLSVIWLAAILYSQYRQGKAAEKERVKRLKEDEINRAIAARKVELEVLVAERTLELTQQKEALQHTLDELRETQAQLIQSEKMASLGELTAGIAHEIQNPLNFVNNFSEISRELLEEMKEELVNGNNGEVMTIANGIEQNLEKIIHHGKRADSIVKGMLQHSRISSGVREPTDINALADEYLRLAYHGLRAKDKTFNAVLKTDFDKSVGEINVIPQEIGRVMLNLLTNAFYAVSEKRKLSEKGIMGDDSQPDNIRYSPTVSVTTKKFERQVEIRVSDNGDGIPKEVVDKIFQPFFTTKPAGKGTGLGLSMCYEIVTKVHGGELKVENKPGEGAAFTVILPVKT